MKVQRYTRFSPWLAVVALVLLSGCRVPTIPFINGPEPENPLDIWDGPKRQTAPSDHGTGLDPRSRQIERNLGFN